MEGDVRSRYRQPTLHAPDNSRARFSYLISCSRDAPTPQAPSILS